MIGDMTMMGVECMGKRSLLMDCSGGDMHLRLTSMAYAPEAQ